MDSTAALQMCVYHNWVLFLLVLSSPPNSDPLKYKSLKVPLE